MYPSILRNAAGGIPMYMGRDLGIRIVYIVACNIHQDQ